MVGIKNRIKDAYFLWENGRKESAFLLVLIALAGLSKLRYPNLKDGESFRKVIDDFKTVKLSVEFR